MIKLHQPWLVLIKILLLMCVYVFVCLQSSGEVGKIPLQPLHPPAPMTTVQVKPPTLSSPFQPRPQNKLRLDDDDESMSGDEEFEDAFDEVGSLDPQQQIPLAPPQHLVGSNTHQIQLMKASFFSKDDISQTASLQHTPISHPARSVALEMQQHSPFSSPHRATPFSTSRQAAAFTTPQHAVSFATPRHVTPYSSPRHITPFSTPRNAAPFATPQYAAPFATPRHAPPLTTPRHAPPFATPRHAASSSSLAQAAILMSKQDLKTLVPVRDSLQTNNERCLCDHSLFLGRSFRVGWGPNGTLVHSGIQISPSAGIPIGQGALLSRRPAPIEQDSLPIRVVVEQLTFNSVSKDCDSVSCCYVCVCVCVTREKGVVCEFLAVLILVVIGERAKRRVRHPLSLPIKKNVWVVCTSKPQCAYSQFYVKRRSGRTCIYEKPACYSRVQLRKALFTYVKTTKRMHIK